MVVTVRGGAQGQSVPEGDDTLQELENLLDQEVTVSSLSPRPLREAPGVVTVITREEIADAGARSLMDVLRLVPGFDFAVDVEGSVAPVFRGNWGTEGKILVLLDGQELNEPLYLTTQFGNRFPLDHIERIEVMRGPGSAIYGGNAELAVVNIVTRRPADVQGGSLSSLLGTTASGLSRGRLSMYAGGTSARGRGLAASVAATFGLARQSDQTYRDFFGNEYPLPNRQDLTWFNVGASAYGFEFRFIHDQYHTTSRDAFAESLPAAVPINFTNTWFEVRRPMRLSERMVLTPRVSYKRQTPWQVTDPEAGGPMYYDKTADKLLSGFLLAWDPEEGIDLLFGAEYVLDTARLNRTDTAGLGLQQLFDGRTTSTLHTLAGYGQALLWHPIANLLVGARFEYNTKFGSTYVPRIAVTKAFSRLHFKLLASRAFKRPGHENLGLNPEIEPETTTAYDAEIGYRVSRQWYVQLNAFHVLIENPIIYTYIGDKETYANFEKTGTGGAEAEIRFHSRRARAALRYAWFIPLPGSDVATYKVEGHPHVVRGLPGHRLTLDGAVTLGHVTVAPVFLFTGPRYAALAASERGVPQDGRDGPSLLINIVATYRNLFVPGLDLSVGVFDLLDSRPRWLQPHNSGHAPLPGLGREWIVRAAFSHVFD